MFIMVEDLYAGHIFIDPALQLDLAVASLGSPQRRPDFFLRYSPAFYAQTLPPILILHGREDETVPVRQATRLAEELARLGRPHELVLYDGQPHYPGVENPTANTLEVAGKTEASALREAQLGILDEYWHPFYWAPFVLVGEGT